MTIRDRRFMMKQLQHWRSNWRSPLQYSCLENPMGVEAWQATVHRVAKSRTQLSNSHTHTFAAHIRIKELVIYSIFKPIHQLILTLALTPFVTPFIVIINYWLHFPCYATDPYPYSLFILYIVVSTNSSPLYCTPPPHRELL